MQILKTITIISSIALIIIFIFAGVEAISIINNDLLPYAGTKTFYQTLTLCLVGIIIYLSIIAVIYFKRNIETRTIIICFLFLL